ncbi:MAG: Zn-ribbon domain-containing OB-fold protein, partial [Vulcanimicrobiaceae bacterium]
GTVYTYAIVRQPIEAAYAALVPYCIAVVELAEGVRMLTRITGDVEAVACGKPVRVNFEALSPALTIPVFQLDGEGESHA